MKQVLLDRYGTPEEVTRCADVPDVGPPGPGEVVFEVLLFPINPTDVWFCKGESRLRPPLTGCCRTSRTRPSAGCS